MNASPSTGLLLDSLRRILHKFPSTRISLAGTLRVRHDAGKHLAGGVAAVPLTPTEGDIIQFLCVKLREDKTLEEIDKSSGEDIMKAISETISEMQVGSRATCQNF